MANENGKVGPTRRVILKRERVLVLPDGLTGEAFEKTKADIAKAVGVRAGALASVDAWVVVADGEGSKTQAIEEHAGKPGTPDAKVGAYRAPNVSSWQGGLVYDAPPLPLVERRELED